MRIYVFFLLFLQIGVISAQEVSSDLKFIQNIGQWEKQVKYRADLPGGKLFAEQNVLTYIFYDTKLLADLHGHHHSVNEEQISQNEIAPKIKIHAFKVNLVGAKENASIIPYKTSSEKYNYYLGNDSTKWKSGARASSELLYKGIYDNIDFKLYEQNRSLKYEFIVQPGASPSNIKLKYEGLENIFIQKGNLVLKTSVTTIVENAPYVYQSIDGREVPIKSKFSLKDSVVTFELLQSYNKNYPLVIDPQLIFSTYSGSTADNWGNTAAFDDAGNMYSGGTVFGIGYPSTVGAFQVNYAGVPLGAPPFYTNYGLGIDVGILKFNPTGTALLYATYIGGFFTEAPYSLVVNSNDELVIMGTTSSFDFPTTLGAFDNTFNGGVPVIPVSGIIYNNGSDIFVSRLSNDGSALLASTYIGGSANDGIQLDFEFLTANYGDQLRGDVITDDLNNIYVACNTRSNNFPVTISAFQSTISGNKDACIFKLNSDMTTMIWSTYLGGTSEDVAYSIQVDSVYNVYISGGTASANFPVTAGVYQTAYQGNVDGFIAHIQNDGQALLSSTFVGTNQYDQLYFVQLDQNQRVYVLGQTRGAYPVTAGTYSNANAGQLIHAFTPELTATVFSTVVGSGGFQPNISPTAFLVNECGILFLSGWGGENNEGYIGGNTNGMAVTSDAYRSTSDGSDFYIMVLSDSAKALLYATYFGMNDAGTPDHVDGGTSRFDRKGIIYEAVCGGCGNNDNFPTTPGAWSNTNNSFNCNNAAFKFDLTNLEAIANAIRGDSCGKTTVTIGNSSIGGKDYFWDFGDGETSTDAYPGTHYYNAPGNYTIMLIVTDLTTCIGKDTTTIHLFVPPIPPITFDLSTAEICQGSTVQLGATDDPTYLYQWTPSTSLSNPNVAKPVSFPNETTVYHVVVRDTNQCIVESDITVNVLPSPTLDKGPDKLICPNTTTQLFATSSGTFVWEASPHLSCTTCPNPIITPPPVSDEYYTVEVTDTNGCKRMDSVRVTTRPFPEITVSFDWNGRCEGETFIFKSDIAYSDLTCPIVGDYNWNFGDGKTSDAENSIHAFDKEGTYIVAVQYAYSQPSFDTIVVLSKDSCLKNIFIPNTFTPNGDGVNDLVYLRTINATKILFKIFNRWGEKVFETESLTEGWDGTYKGVKQTPQVFVYYAEVTFWDDTNKVLEGNITLIE